MPGTELTLHPSLHSAGTAERRVSTLTRYDSAHRPVQVSSVSYVNGKAQAPQLQVRYEYGSDPANPQPMVVARPSVVPGKEHITRISYNTAGQIIRITEVGFSPLDAQGQVATGTNTASAISRSTTYTYQTINGRSVLKEIDGPLPNGPANTPADSDISTFSYDQRADYLVGVTQPGNFQTRYTHDAAGRITLQSLLDGYRQIDTATRYEGLATAALQASTITRSAWLLAANGQIDSTSVQTLKVLQAKFDALGRRTQSLDSAARITHHQYDSAGHLLGVADGQGYRSQLTLDTEGRTHVAGLYLPGQVDPTKPYRAAYSWHDEQGRLTQRLLPDGRLDHYRYDAQGQLIEHEQNHGEGGDILHSYRSNADRNAQAHIAQTSDGWLRLNVRGRSGTAGTQATAPVTLLDDFGRVVRQALPDHGIQSARYDAANHITELHSADGAHLAYSYDPAGRLVRKSYQAKAQQAAQVLAQLSYQGLLLQALSDPAQTTSYQLDALGRKTLETITLAGLSPAQPLHIATHYDRENALVSERVLADGRVLRSQRTSAQTGATVHSLVLQSRWSAWLQAQLQALLPNALAQLLVKALPSETIAQDIAIHPFNGLVGYTAGNAVTTAKTYDIAGRLTALSYQGAGDATNPSTGIGTLQYRYGVGPRIQQINDQAYRYQGFGKLVLPDNTLSSPPFAIKTGAASARPGSGNGQNDAQNPDTTQRPTFDALGRTIQDSQYRYCYTSVGQLETVADKTSGQTVARYRYNSLHQRVSKTVGQGEHARTTHYLWQNKLLVAELDEQGHITSQYLYLSEGQHATPIAKLESAHNADNPSHKERILFIHSDHRATPIAMTDEKQQVLWRADISPRGVMRVADNKQAANAATLNIRLPGQYFDAETGLHDNWHRTYNPQTGRYLQPDPLGYPDGPDAYLYASGDPINKMDPTGLYQEDMHYYMVFFLSLAAGMDYEKARITALASQFVDDNEITRPLDDETTLTKLGSIVKNQQQLKWYHFTLSDDNGQNLPQYDNSDVTSVSTLSPQLNNLLNASNIGNPDQPCAKYQFLGEFLHAYADTFGHRDGMNRPFDALSLGLGVGHGLSGSQPDYTYNGDPDYTGNDPQVIARFWNVREARTFEAEKAIFNQLTGYAATMLSGVSFSEIADTLHAFNKIEERAEAGSPPPTQKLKLLQDTLNGWLATGKLKLKKTNGSIVTEIDFSTVDSYKEPEARTNRSNFLGSLTGQEAKYPGVCLPGSTVCMPVKL